MMAGTRRSGTSRPPPQAPSASAPRERTGSGARFRLGLRTRIALFFASLLLLVNVAVLATQKEPIVRVLEGMFSVRGRELALGLAARAGLAGDGLREVLQEYAAFEDVKGAAIVRADGPAASAGVAVPDERAPEQRPRPGEVVTRAGTGWTDFWAAVPGTDAVARVRLGRGTLSASVSRIGWTIASIAAAAVGAGFLLVFAAASAFTGPIRQLASLALQIRAGALGARLEVVRSDEIGELASAMNAMSGDLAENHRRLRDAQEELQSQNAALRRQGQELAAQGNHLKTLVESISEGVLFVDRDRRVATANRAAQRIARIPPARVPGLGLEEFAAPGDPLRTLLEDACARAERNERFESQTLLADHLHTVATVHAPGGEALGVLAVIHDLSKVRALEAEQKELLGQLYQQEKMAVVGLLAASLAHEINTPLGTILLHTQRVARAVGEGGSTAAALATVEREIHRCRDIVRRLLDFSRLAESHPVLLDLSDPIARCVSLLEAGLRQKGITIRTSAAPSVPQVKADPDRIEQVLVNLISNAVDAMPHGGGIDISLRPGKEGAELVVRDEGKGIPPEDLERIFEPFFTTKPKGKGTGLGLAICRRIVDEARGRIEIGPAAGGGTEVRIGLPAADGSDG